MIAMPCFFKISTERIDVVVRRESAMRYFGSDASANKTKPIADCHYHYREMTTRSSHHITSLAENIPIIFGADRECPGARRRCGSSRASAKLQRDQDRDYRLPQCERGVGEARCGPRGSASWRLPSTRWCRSTWPSTLPTRSRRRGILLM